MAKPKKQLIDKGRLLTMAGVIHSGRAFCAPEVLHIDLTNWCNFNCIACWCRSPLLGDKAMPDWEKKLILPFKVVRQIVDDISAMGGLRQVKLVGGGEPFMHPDILKIIEYIKGKDPRVQIDINTNFSLITEPMAKRLLELWVDSFTVSLWAGTPEAYAAVHPNQTGETLLKIKKVLMYISEMKKQRRWFHPRMVIHDVVFNRNYKDVEGMLKFALDVDAASIQFVPVDPVKDRTEVLILDDKQRAELLETLYRIRKNYDPMTFNYTHEDGRVVNLPDFDGFIRRIEKFNLKSGAYDEDVVDEIPCYVGWLFARVMATGNVVPCCKGHRMPMGNVFEKRFRDIWFSGTYNQFREKCVTISKSDPYFSRMGNAADAKTGCYNCDNLWQNIPMHKRLMALKAKNKKMVAACGAILKRLFR